MEIRQLTSDFEVRKKDNGEMVVQGYALRYNQPSQDLGGFIEVVREGAVTNSLKNNDIALLYNHESRSILGRTSAGTLTLRDSSEGLFFEAILPNTQLGRDTYESLKRGDLRGMSFGFTVKRDDWNFKDKTMAKRYLHEINLREVSITPFPAYESSSVSIRCFEEAKEKNQKIKEIEEYFHKKGC